MADVASEVLFSSFYTDVSCKLDNNFLRQYTIQKIFKLKAIERKDAVFTPKQQIDRLLRKGSTYFNLNPFEVFLNYVRLEILVKNMVTFHRYYKLILIRRRKTHESNTEKYFIKQILVSYLPFEHNLF